MEYIERDSLLDYLNMRIYFDESEIDTIFEKAYSLIRNKNYHKMRLESFIFFLFHENQKNLSKFLIDFFIRNENILNNNYLDIFSNDLQYTFKIISDIKNNCSKEYLIPNANAYAISHANYDEGLCKIKNRQELLTKYKKYFELNFKKSFFTINDQDFCLKAKIFTKILKAVFRSKGLIQNFNLLHLGNMRNMGGFKHNSNSNGFCSLETNCKKFILMRIFK